MYYRIMERELRLSASKLPVVTVLGPRQSGKTTLARETFPNKPYVNMESLHVREIAKHDPISFLEILSNVVFPKKIAPLFLVNNYADFS